MAMNQSPLLEMLDALKAADADEFIRRMLAMMLQEMINANAMIMMGTGPYVRSADRTTQHTGTRDRSSPPPWTTSWSGSLGARVGIGCDPAGCDGLDLKVAVVPMGQRGG